MRRLALTLAALLALNGALAVEYQVDASGGPDTLGARVQAAFAAWQELEPNFTASETAGADVRIRYGSAANFGPDILTLTVQRQPGPPSLEVLVNPSDSSELGTALLHETGLLFGLSPSSAGVLDPAIRGPAELGEAERAELEALATFAREDLDRSGTVDFYDLLILARAFGQRGVNLPGDLNGDGAVDEADLELLRAAYTFSAPAPEPPAPPESAAPEALPEVPAPSENEPAPEPPAPPEEQAPDGEPQEPPADTP